MLNHDETSFDDLVKLVCDVCGKKTAKRQRGLCKECRGALKLSKTLTRIQKIENKYDLIKPVLSQHATIDDAKANLDYFFSKTQKKFLNAALERYYNHRTLQEIGDEWNVSREYVRQCEDRALKIISTRCGL